MGRRYRRIRRLERERLPIFLIAFGLGLFLALFGTLRLALLLAALALIYIGVVIYWC